MQRKRNFYCFTRLTFVGLFFYILLQLSACGGGSSSGAQNPSITPSPSLTSPVNHFSGVAQKGPFASESNVVIRQFTHQGQATGKSLHIKTSGLSSHYAYTLPHAWQDDSKPLPVEITVQGFFVDEAVGGISDQQLTLNALLPFPSNSSVNLLTHWAALRAKILSLSKGLTVADALKQARAELKLITGIAHANELDMSQSQTYVSDNAQLLLLSGALLDVAKRNQVSQQVVVNDIALDFSADGQLNNQGKNWFKRLQASIRDNPKARTNRFAQGLTNYAGLRSGLATINGNHLPETVTLASRPQAIAPKVILAQPNETVTLDGSASHDSGEIINFTWFLLNPQSQFSVSMSDRFVASPTFVAPAQESELLFALIVTDSAKLTDTTVVKVVVKKPPPVVVNNAPVANSQSVVTDEDTPINIVISGNDPDGDSLVFDAGNLSRLLQHGLLEGSAPNLRYTPDANYFGADLFGFNVNDGLLSSQNATVNITVNPINDKPIADPKTITTDEDIPKSVTLSGSDIENDPLSFAIVTPPAHGVLDLSGMPSVLYRPDTQYNGSDSFTYKVNDGDLDSDPATVSITVLPVNGQPIANPQSISTNQDVSRGVLLTGSDPEGDDLTFEVTIAPSNGTLTGNIPNLVYQPFAGFNGVDSFGFKVNDGEFDSAIAAVQITVLAADNNKQPLSNGQTVTTTVNQPVPIVLSGSDPDGDTLVFRLVSNPLKGTLSGAPPNLDYKPNDNFIGDDSFFFIVYDGKAFSNLALVTIHVLPQPNVPPVAKIIAPSTIQAGETIPLDGSQSTDSDGTLISYVWSSPAGSIPAGVISNLIAPIIPGNIDIVLTVTDNDGASHSTTKHIVVTKLPNVPPVARFSAPVSVVAGQPILLDASASTDSDGSIISYEWTSLAGVIPDGVSTSFNAPTTLGNIDVTLKVTDNEGVPHSVTKSIEVTKLPNVPPVARFSAPISIEVGQPIVLDGSASTDSDGSITSYVWSSLAGVIPAGISTSFTAPTTAGDIDVTLTVTDNDNATHSVTKRITVRDPSNIPPVARFTVPQSAEVNALIHFDGSASSDSDGTIVSYEWSTSAAQTASGSTVAFTMPSTTGVITISLTVMDNDGAQHTVSKSITLVLPNPPPVAVISAPASVEINQDFEIDAFNSTDDGTIVSYAWVTSVGNFTGDNPILTAPESTGNISLQLTVTDNDGATGVATANIPVVSQNQPPIANPATVQIDTSNINNDTVILLTGSDPDGGGMNAILTYQIVTQPASGIVSLNGATATYTPISAPVSDTFDFIVIDEKGLASVAPATVTLTPPPPINQPPVIIEAPGNFIVNDGETVNLNAIASDDNDPESQLTFKWSSNGIPPFSGTGKNLSFTATNSTDTAVVVTFTLQVFDTKNLASDPVTFNITINPTNQAPTAISAAFNLLELGNVGDPIFSFVLTGNDPEGKPLTFEIVTPPVVDSQQINLSLNPTTGVATFSSQQGSGSFSFTFRVIDDQGLPSAPASVAVKPYVYGP